MEKVLYEVHFQYQVGLLIPIVLFVVFYFYSSVEMRTLKYYKNDLEIYFRKVKRREKLFRGVALFFILPLTIIIHMVIIVGSFILINDYHNKNYEIVSGFVEKFNPMPFAGHQDETFQIKDVKFTYSDYVITAGYRQSLSHGGVIKGNGQMLKIGYVKYGNTNVIVYIAEIGPYRVFQQKTL